MIFPYNLVFFCPLNLLIFVHPQIFICPLSPTKKQGLDKNTIGKHTKIENDISLILNEEHIKMLVELDNYLPISGSFFCVVNIKTKTFIHTSKNFYPATRLSKEKMRTSGVRYYASRIHPSDKNFWQLSCKELLLFSTSKLGEPIQKKHINHITNYRLKNGLGEYINIIESTTPIQFDQDNRPIVVYSCFTVLHPKLQIDTTTSIRYLNEYDQYESLFFKNYAAQKIINKISTREKEVLQLLVSKKSSKEIGKKLHISFNTVNTHRRNILKKLNLNSTGELLSYVSNQLRIEL